MDMVRDSKPHLMILDVMMPRKSGYDVCEEVKSDPDLRDIHVMMLTAKGQVGDREIGLFKGADEYLTKPFSPSNSSTKSRNYWADQPSPNPASDLALSLQFLSPLHLPPH